MVTCDPLLETLPRMLKWTAEPAGTTSRSIRFTTCPLQILGAARMFQSSAVAGQRTLRNFLPILGCKYTHAHTPYVSRTKQETALQMILKLSGQTQGGRGKGKEETQLFKLPQNKCPSILLLAPTQTLQALV